MKEGDFLKKVYLASMPDVLDAKDVSKVLGIGYVKALRLIQYGDMNYIKVGRTYKVSKQNFVNWLNCPEPKIIELD